MWEEKSLTFGIKPSTRTSLEFHSNVVCSRWLRLLRAAERGRFYSLAHLHTPGCSSQSRQQSYSSQYSKRWILSHLLSLKLVSYFMLLKLQINCRNNSSAYIMACGQLVEWKSFTELMMNMNLSLLHSKISRQETKLGTGTHLSRSSPSK